MGTKAKRILEECLQEQHYKLSSTQINLPSAHADYLIKWGREMIPNEHLYYDDKGGLGREDEPHITVLYGLKGAEPGPELLKLIKKTSPFTVRLTSVTLFDDNPDYDVVKFDVDSDELKSLSDAIRQACPNENKFPVFQGHSTIAYVKKGRVPDLAGNYPFQQNPPIPAEFEVNEVIFKPAGESGDPNRKPIRIPLNRYRQEAESPLVAEAEDPKAMFRAIRAKEQPRVTDGLYYADVSWEDIRKLKELGMLGAFNGRAFPLVSGRGQTPTMDDVEMALDMRRLRQYRWVTAKEAEDPKAALKKAKEAKRITRALMFKHVPEGFYFRSPWFPLVKKQLDPETGCNAVTADLDMVRPLKFEPDYWVFPVEWTIDDITTSHRIESLSECRTVPQERIVYGPEGLDEAEDPKTIFRLAKAGSKKWVMTRVTDAYGNPLRAVHYLEYFRNGIDGPPMASWTLNFSSATQFSSEKEAWQTMRECFGDDLAYFKGGISADPLNPLDVNSQRFKLRQEAEDPRQTLKQIAQDTFVVWSYYAGVIYFWRLEKRWGRNTYLWTQEQHMASRFRTQEAAEAFKDEFYPEDEAKRHNVRVSTVSQALAYRGESEDPKHFLKNVAGTLPKKRFRVNWLDQRGNIHSTTFGVSSAETAVEHLRRNLERMMRNGNGAHLVSDIVCVDDISSLEEGEDPKQAFRKATRQLVRPRRYKNLPDGYYFKFNHEDQTICVKLNGAAFLIDNLVTPYWSKSMANGEYICYPASWSYEKIKAHSRHISMHPEAFKESEDPKAVFRAIVNQAHPGYWLMGRWRGAAALLGGEESAWSYFGDFPEGWGWTPVAAQATVARPDQIKVLMRRIKREAPDYQLRAVPVEELRQESKQPSPFDLLRFPTDASVLAAKLLDLEHDVKPAVL